MSVAPVTPLAAPDLFGSAADLRPAMAGSANLSFSRLLHDGIENVSAKVAEADRLAKAFVLDDNIPIHQVTYAIEQARLSLELMMQIRSRLVEGYQQLMNMQL